MHCPSCGRDVEPAWRFCFHCGAAIPEGPEVAASKDTLPVPPPVPDQDELVSAQDHGRGNRRRVALVTVAIVAVLGLLTAGVLVHLDVRGDLRDTELTLASTEEDLTRTTEELGSTDAKLAETRARLQETVGERDDLRNELRRVKADLQGVRGSLAEAQETVQLQSGQIEDLKACLDGVAEALDHVIYGYYDAAINALTRVEGSCNAAFALF